MAFTIEQLEALKEGAPVMHRSSKGDGDGRSHSVKADNGMLRALVGYGPDGGTACKDAELFSAAPVLVDALIAEKQAHQELRASIGRLRDWYNERGEYMYNLYEESLDRQFKDDSDSYSFTANQLSAMLDPSDEDEINNG